MSPYVIMRTVLWRGGRVAEGAPLLREYTLTGIAGSNPALSAIFVIKPLFFKGFFVCGVCVRLSIRPLWSSQCGSRSYRLSAMQFTKLPKASLSLPWLRFRAFQSPNGDIVDKINSHENQLYPSLGLGFSPTINNLLSR